MDDTLNSRPQSSLVTYTLGNHDQLQTTTLVFAMTIAIAIANQPRFGPLQASITRLPQVVFHSPLPLS